MSLWLANLAWLLALPSHFSYSFVFFIAYKTMTYSSVMGNALPEAHNNQKNDNNRQKCAGGA